MRNTGVWSEQQELIAPDGVAGDVFGSSVSVYANTAIVGAPNHMVGGNPDQGAAYAFVRSGTNDGRSKGLDLTSSDGSALTVRLFGIGER